MTSYASSIDEKTLYRIAEGRIDSIAHPGRHGTGNFQIFCGHRIAILIIDINFNINRCYFRYILLREESLRAADIILSISPAQYEATLEA